MANNIAHFAMHADDVERAKSFYAEVFGWTFNAYGPPNFYQIQTGPDDDPGVRGAVQERNQQGDDIRGFECTISVDSLDDTLAAVERGGGTVVLDKCAIPHVGWLFKFRDTEGNLVVAMQYDSEAN
jgi:uncharacterized protein